VSLLKLRVRRRELIAGLGSVAVWPLTAGAQQAVVPVVGYLSNESPGPSEVRLAGFRQGLKDAGYVEGQNVAIEYRWAEGDVDRLPALAADLVRRKVAVIYAFGPAASVAKAATQTIPIVFAVGSDPVAIGLVAALNRPGGNLTGATNFGMELMPKRLELLHQIVPTATTVAALLNPANSAAEEQPKSIEATAHALGLEVHVLHASSQRGINNAFAGLDKLRASALLIFNDGLFINQSQLLGALSSQHALPAIFQTREFAAAGGLISYGGDTFREQDRQTGIYVGRILRGEKPAGLPVMQPTNFELIINLRTANALGLTIPTSLLVRADEVIE
jgi:putative tryptophan/tyrosine transport system substrate-binding protein